MKKILITAGILAIAGAAVGTFVWYTRRPKIEVVRADKVSGEITVHFSAGGNHSVFTVNLSQAGTGQSYRSGKYSFIVQGPIKGSASFIIEKDGKPLLNKNFDINSAYASVGKT